MTLRHFCDLVWLEIWTDCAPMSDQSTYRRIVEELFIQGKPAWEITYDGYDDKGKKVTKRLAPRPLTSNKSLSTSGAYDEARELALKLRGGVKVNTKGFVEAVQAAKEAAEVASPPSG